MRILAIRGKNLASLAGDFELHFQQSPLATAGLFAICGPTGSGKSTLLDALCLALYDDTPRLTRAVGKSIVPDVGADTLTPQDSRNLLRRGAGEGFAEVDFIGNDRVAYRARWSVRRARGKADGKLQSTELLLQTLDGGQSIGGVKTEVQQAIRERLGLTFEQFTRAVLLAQNEFAAFLKADDNERAKLLETLTGLDIYTGISIRAFERAKHEQEELKRLNEQLVGQQPLDADARAGLEQTLAAAKTETALLEQRKTALNQQWQWHGRWQTLQQEEQQALFSLDQARTAQQAAAPRQQRLAQVEAAQNARLIVGEVERSAAEAVKQRQTVLNAAEKQEAAQRLLQQAEQARTKATEAVAAAEQQRNDASAALQQARSLDAAIQALLPGHVAAEKTLTDAQQAEIAAQKQLTNKQAERQQLARQQQTAQDWLTQHQPLRVLADDWSRWDGLLRDAATLQTRLRDAEQIALAGQRDLQNQRQMLDQATRCFTQTETALHTAQIHLQTALATLSRFDAEALAARRQTLQTRRDQLAEAEWLWMKLDGGLARQRELEDERGTLQAQVAQAETALTQLLAEQPAAIARLEQAEKSLKTAEAACAKSVESLRARLENGCPCPVCGAIEHPYALGDAPSHDLLASFKAEVKECRTASENLRTQEAAQRTRCDADRQRLTVLAKEQETLTAALQRDSAAWNAHPLATELQAIVPADRSPWFADHQQRAQKDLDAITQEEDAQRQAAKLRDDAQIARDQAQTQHSTAQNALNAAQIAFEQAAQTVKTAQERQAELNHQLAEQLSELDAAFSGYHWRPLWQADPAGFHTARRQKVAQWREQSEKVERDQQQIASLDVEIAGQTATVADKAEHRQRAAEAFQTMDGDLQNRRQQRQTLFNGRAVAEVEAQFTRIIEDARNTLQQQEEIAQKARQEHISAETTLKQEQKTLAERQQTAEQAVTGLQQWIVDFNARQPDAALDVAALRALLTHDHVWIDQERQTLQTLADAVKNAETLLKERQAQREAHERQRASADSAAVVQEAQQKTEADLQAARHHATEAEITLRQDNERRAATQELIGRIVQQERIARVWNQLNELIGSADGKKFRNHAQQFTLDVLLGYANCHLADVSRRYRLERIDETLALMVVDQDMGDERRSVHSLSGGESFLVSLALALGLASLSSNRVRVESLFIDEGFGSLDADTLRIAMDALDRLQAQGRKVGVISHVPEMTERIGVQIHVQRQSGGQSRVEVRSV